MPLILTVGLAKELRQPDGRSLSATCNVSVKLDAALLTGDPDAFQCRVRNAYAACRQAVDRELARQTAIEMKRELLDEALYFDDLNDRMASALDEIAM